MVVWPHLCAALPFAAMKYNSIDIGQHNLFMISLRVYRWQCLIDCLHDGLAFGLRKEPLAGLADQCLIRREINYNHFPQY